MILVTGGTGLVGSHLLWHLVSRGEKVRALIRPGSGAQGVREAFDCYEGKYEGQLFGKHEEFFAKESTHPGTPLNGDDPPSGEKTPSGGKSPSGGKTPSGGKNTSGEKLSGENFSSAESYPGNADTDPNVASPDSVHGNTDRLFETIEWFKGDILDPVAVSDALEGVGKVYHCAAIVSFNPSERKKVISDNIRSTATIVNACLEQNGARLCHVSSVSALGHRYDGEPVTENDLWKPSKRRSAYSISKFHSEMEVWRGIAEGLDAVIVNPSVILGPGNWHRGSAGFFTRIQKGLKYYTGGMTGFVDVRDVCRCMIALMESGFSAERFIINSEDLWYRDLFNMIADALGKPPPSKYASKPLVEAGWRLEWLRSRLTFSKPLLTRETARSGRSISRFSNEKIRQALGCRFFPVRETVEWTARELMNKS